MEAAPIPAAATQTGFGRPSKDHRRVINGLPRLAKTGAPWRDLPDRHGPWLIQIARQFRPRFFGQDGEVRIGRMGDPDGDPRAGLLEPSRLLRGEGEMDELDGRGLAVRRRAVDVLFRDGRDRESGRASCRERVWK